MPDPKNTKRPGAYQVLARRYRSRSFDEILGQTSIVRTLRNAIEHDRTAHAYLFCGTRGVGKTSTARVFAHELMAHGCRLCGEPEPNKEIVDAIFRGEEIDVVEIDGASNRGINEARELIANSGLMPSRLPFKIYIIDEVHMLTKEAFNALLKTMEEPPLHVKFILCTTEAQKVPQTIQSRCQRFDFRRIADREISRHLGEVLSTEGVEFDENATLTIARLADGSMRDGLTLLDRVIAATEGKISAEVIAEILGLPDETLLEGLTAAIAERDCKSALQGVDGLVRNGMQPALILEVLAERLRRLLVVATCGEDPELLAMTDDAMARAAALAGSFDSASLVYMIVACDAGARQVSGSGASRALLDAVIVRLCLVDEFARAAELLAEQPAKKEQARAR
jgi:DNA polymerase-3 subunit gamma/tau